MNNKKDNELNKESLYGGLAVIVVGVIMTGLSIISGGLGEKFSNLKWRNSKEVKQGNDINN